MDHLRFAGAGPEAQRRALIEIIAADAMLMGILRGLAAMDLPDGLLVSGALYNTVWNTLTGRPSGHGIRDADVAYFDSSDLTYAAEDRVIQRVQAHFRHSSVPVEARNQARVHLWFPQKFGIDYPTLQNSVEMLNYFTTMAYAVGVRLEAGEIRIFAPFGLDDLFAFRLRPNPALPNKATHEAKAKRAMTCWPELVFEEWPN